MNVKILHGMSLAAAVLLTACGGDSGGGSGGNPPQTSSKFTESATWEIALPASGQSVCYDFNAKAVVAGCSGTSWDLKLTNHDGLGYLWTNSGSSGSGGGGSLGGPSTEYNEWLAANRGPDDTENFPGIAWLADSVGNVFTGTNEIGSAIFEYDLDGGNLMWPSYRTFLLTTDSSKSHVSSDNVDGVKVYALQLIGYYGGPNGATSGYVTLRYVERLDGNTWSSPQTATVNATNYVWVYFNLDTKQVVNSPAGSNWHIAFQRYSVKLNGGNVGTGGTMGGYVAYSSPTLYPGGSADADQLMNATPANTLADLTSDNMDFPASAAEWVQDKYSSPLGPEPTGTAPELDYGWFALDASGFATAKADHAALLRSGEGNSFARIRVADIAYADSDDAGSQQTWTIEFDIQPKP